MKRARAYSDDYDGEYKKFKVSVPQTGIFLFTRSSKHINNLLDQNALLTIFSRCDCVTLLSKATRVCRYWNSLISNPNNRNSILYRSIQEGRIDIHHRSGDFSLARELCKNSSTEIAYFEMLNKKIIEEILQSAKMSNLLQHFIQKKGLKCNQCFQNILNKEPMHLGHLNQFQKHIQDIATIVLDFMDEDKTRFTKGYPTIVANFMQKLIPSLNATGKINIATRFQLFLKAPVPYKSFIKLVQLEYIYYFNVIDYLCKDPSLHVKKEAALVAALMAIRFPLHQNEAWILFLDTLQSNSAITQYYIETIDRNHLPNGFRVLDLPHRMAVLLASNNVLFIACLRNNFTKFIIFLEDLFSCNTISAKASATIILLMIAFNQEMTSANEKEFRIKSIQEEFDKNPSLLKKFINELNNCFYQVDLTNFSGQLSIEFPSLRKALKFLK